MGLTPVKSSAGKAMNPPPPATEFNSPPAMAAKNKRIACANVTLQCTCFAFSLNALQLGHGALILKIAGVERLLRLDQHDVDFFVGVRKMLDSMGNDNELAWTDDLLPLHPVFADAHLERAFDDEKHLVFPLVVVPHEVALHLRHLHIHVVHFTDNSLVKVV